MNRQAMHSYLMNGGADRDGMKAISDAVISSISSARVARGEEGLSDDEVTDAREKASGIIDGAFADNAGKERSLCSIYSEATSWRGFRVWPSNP